MTANKEQDYNNLPKKSGTGNFDGNSEVEKNRKTGSDEIDLIELFLAFWKERRILYITIGVFAVIGLIIAFTADEEYTSEVKLLPEERDQGGVSSGIARQFGMQDFRTETTEGTISARYYPDIAKSILFIQPILDHKVYLNEINDSLTVKSYFNDHYSRFDLISEVRSVVSDYTIRLPFTIQGWFKRSSNGEETAPSVPEESEAEVSKQEISDMGVTDLGLAEEMGYTIDLTRSELRAINSFKDRIEIEREDGIIIVSVKMPEPELSAELTDKVTRSLIDYIKDYRTEKARKDMEYTRERYEEARRNFERAQERLARFRDESRGELTQMARTEEELLQSEYDLAFNVYNNLAGRLEEARLKLQEETPVVKVLEPAMIPSSPSEPNREFLFIVYLVLGFIVGNGIIFFKLVRRKIKEAISNRG